MKKLKNKDLLFLPVLFTILWSCVLVFLMFKIFLRIFLVFVNVDLYEIVLWSCVLVFLIFKIFLRIFLVFVNVDLYEIVLINKWGYWLRFLRSYFYWVTKVLMRSTNYCFGMHAYRWWRIKDADRGGMEEGFRSSFWKLKKVP